MMDSLSKIRVYTNGLVENGVGAYAYIVIENVIEDAKIVGLDTTVINPSLLRAKFAMAGPCEDDMRMKMRAAYEGVRHCPAGTAVEVYTDNFLVDSCLDTIKAAEEDGDIADRYRKHLASSGIKATYHIAKVYNGRDLPDNDHDEWTWFAYHLCEDAIRKYNKEHKK